ncbi:MAG: aminotransferase class V-fold PLP-dependent enzyme, partial [Acidimicrobiales bacterium]
MAVDVDRARALTPGCAHVAHLNNAGASLMPAPVVDAVIEHLRLEARIAGIEAAEAAAERIDHAYDAVAGMLGCDAGEVAVVENATRAWDMAFYAVTSGLGPGDRILTGSSEYSSNAMAMGQVARRTGAEAVALPDDGCGQIDLDALDDALTDERVGLVAITHVPTHGGLVNPAAEVGRRCRAAGVAFLLDACQSIGQLRVRVDEIGCDMLSATGRKFLRGPRGTGFLYVRAGILGQLDPPFVD